MHPNAYGLIHALRRQSIIRVLWLPIVYNQRMNPTVKTRFAPSPTGLMHFGNVRTALFNYLYAKRFQGQLLLRIEDTDGKRSTTDYTASMLKDLRGLGLVWDEGPYYQSERQAVYEQSYLQLQKEHRLYPCFCTEEQLALSRKVQMAAHQPPRYTGKCRALSAEVVRAKQALGEPFVLRFEVPKGVEINFKDLIKGDQHFGSDAIGDFIVRRADSSASFIFCNALDDALMGVTHALRGDDHLSNTPRQLLILEALGLAKPAYGHFPTILGPDHSPLSKRNGSRDIQSLAAEGYGPSAIVNYLARLGHYDPDMTLLSLETLSAHFDLAHISHAPAHYNEAQLLYWQKLSMQNTSIEDCWHVLEPLVGSIVPEAQRDAFVALVQPNLVLPKDALPLAEALFSDKLSYSVEAQSVIREMGSTAFEQARALRVQDPNLKLGAWVDQLQIGSDFKKKQWYAALRAALMGMTEGPSLQPVLDLLGPEKILQRLLEAGSYANI